MITKPFSWSFSVLEAYETCPMQLYESRITKRFSDRNQWNAAGTNDHSAFENRVLHGQPMPPHLRPYEKGVERLLDIPGEVRTELEICLTESWKPTGWFAKDAWARAKVDLSILNKEAATVTQFDWKFGKRRKDTRWLQLKINNLLFDATCKAQGTVINKFNNGLVWVTDKFDIEPFKLTQDDMDAVRCEVMERVEIYREAYEKEQFPAKQNGLCRKFCPVLSCKFNGRN